MKCGVPKVVVRLRRPVLKKEIPVSDNSHPKDSNADSRNQDLSVLSRHSGMPLAGIQSSASLDSGQNRAGMTEVKLANEG